MKRVPANLPATLVVLGALAGCSALPESAQPVMPSFPGIGEDAGPMRSMPDKGVAVLSAGIDGLECAEGKVVLARRAGDGYQPVARVEIGRTWNAEPQVAAVALAPGEYHVVQYACRNGANVTYVGRPSGEAGSVPWQAGRWPAALAGFSLAGGEVVDLGHIGLTPEKRSKGKKTSVVAAAKELVAPGERAVAVRIETLPEAARARLGEERPQLAAALRARPMRIETTPGPAPAVVKCTLFEEGGGAATAASNPGAGDRSKRKQKGNPSGEAFSAMNSMAMTPTGCREAGAATKAAATTDGKGT